MVNFIRRIVGIVIMTAFVLGALFFAAFIALFVAVLRLFGKQPRVIHVRQVNFDLNDFNPRPPPRDVTPKPSSQLTS